MAIQAATQIETAAGATKAFAAEVEREVAEITAAKAGAAKVAGAGKAAAVGAAAQPGAVAAKSMAGAKTAAAAAPAKVATGGAGMATGAAVIGTGTSATPLAAAISGNSMLASKGVCLGLGFGLGAWGPVILGIAGVAGAVALYDRFRNRQAHGPVQAT